MIAQSDEKLGKDDILTSEHIRARIKGDFPIVTPDLVEYMDVAPNQILSVAASLIPFLEHDDANRALMGSNMQRQSVPLMRPDVPIVGTGIETKVAVDSRSVVIAPVNGRVQSVDSSKIIIRTYDVPEDLTLIEGENLVKVELRKFTRTNQNSCQNQRPIVTEGERIEKGQPIADGTSTQNGELALGKNVTVAFMPWRGYNFEDAIEDINCVIATSSRIRKKNYYIIRYD
jgi:DNA-directed RNA polymerase subunit beta